MQGLEDLRSLSTCKLIRTLKGVVNQDNLKLNIRLLCRHSPLCD